MRAYDIYDMKDCKWIVKEKIHYKRNGYQIVIIERKISYVFLNG